MSKRHLEGRSAYRASGETLTVIYFAKSTSIGPTSRYRIFQFLPVLEERGIECTVRPLFEKTYWKIIEIPSPFLRVIAKMVYVTGRFLRRAWDVLTIGDVDLVVIEGQLFPYMPALARANVSKASLSIYYRVRRCHLSHAWASTEDPGSVEHGVGGDCRQ